MIVHVLSASRDVIQKIEGAALIASMGVETDESPQDFASALYRDRDALGVFWLDAGAPAATACREWRAANVRNVLLSLLPRPAFTLKTLVPILGVGADDVQPDTIDMLELAARLTALSRRQTPVEPPVRILDCIFDVQAGTVSGSAGTVRLTKREGELLGILIARNGAVVTKEMILSAVYQGIDEPETKIIDVFICKLRKKLFHVLGERDVIETAWGRGYRFEKNGIRPNFDDRRIVRVPA